MNHTPNDLLSTIEGKLGENLATAYLKWLLGREGVQQLLLKAISEAVRTEGFADSGDIGNLMNVLLEVGTTTRDGRGRIDLLIETDRWVIGVESKFEADFQVDQPEKYIETIQGRAGTSRNSMLVLLVPERRQCLIRHNFRKKMETRGMHAGDIAWGIISWEALNKRLESLEPERQWERDILRGYSDIYCDPFSSIMAAMSSGEAFAEIGPQDSAIGDRAAQAQMVRALTILGSDLPYIGSGRMVTNAVHYSIYEFKRSDDDERDDNIAIFGFVNRKIYGLCDVAPSRHDRAFVMCRTYEGAGDKEILRQHHLLSIPLERRGSQHKGIVRHNRLDGEVWVVGDDTLRNALKSGSQHAHQTFRQWLEGVFGRPDNAHTSRTV